MILTEWQVWHTYSSYVLEPVDTQATAHNLVESGLCELAVVGGDRCWYRDGDDVRSLRLQTRRNVRGREATLVVPDGLSRFQMGCIVDAQWFDLQERLLLRPSDPRAVRAFMHPCRLEFDGWVVNAYPIVVIYSDGTVLLTFRVLSGDDRYTLREFVEEQVNLFSHEARALWLTPSVLRSYFVARASEDIRDLLDLAHDLRCLDDLIVQHARKPEERYPCAALQIVGLVDVASDHGSSSGAYDLRVLASMLEHAIDAAIRGKTSRARLQGLRPSSWGSSWVGRPSVYLISFEGQPLHSNHVVEKFQAELARIMVRTGHLPPGLKPGDVLGPDLRAFWDYSAFLSREVTLWVFGASHTASADGSPNHAKIVFDKQVQAEFLDHRYAAHRQMEERSASPGVSLTAVFEDEKRIARIERQVEASTFGEINHLIARGDYAMGLEKFRTAARDNLRRRAVLSDVAREQSARRFEWLLTLLVGLVGLPSLADFADPMLSSVLVGWGVKAEWTAGVLFVAFSFVFVLAVLLVRLIVDRSSPDRVL